MPKFTITVTDKALAKLQAVVNTHNQNNGATLTVQQWLDLHVKDVAINQDLAAALQTIQQEQQQLAQAALDAAVSAERDRLLTEL